MKPHQRARTGWRLDGGFGTDANLNWLLPRFGQLVIKGYNATRAAASARRREAGDWQEIGPERWVALEPDGVRYGRRTQSLVLHWLGEKRTDHYALLVHTLLDWPMAKVVQFYDARAQQEVQIRQDKTGLQLTRRRKRAWHAQEAWVILNDLAHNLLAWTHDWMWHGSRFEGYGCLRLVQDVLNLSGHFVFKGDKLQKAALCRSDPLAPEVAECLERLLTELH
ncbi:MAG: transposase [Anaerolineales bacterium]|nr:transposase [Anaerolineales bacterium]